MNMIRCDSVAGTVIYKTKMVQGPNRNFEMWDAPTPRPPPLATVWPADFEYVPCED